MTRSSRMLIASLVTIASAAGNLAAVPSGLARAEAPVAFVDVNVVPMNRTGAGVLANQTVIVRDGRIVEVGPVSQVKVPSDAIRVDGRGKYLMPGLAEMHGHIPPPQAPAAVTEAYLALYTLRGVTTVRTMFGYPNQFELRRRIQAGELMGPTLYTAGPALSGNAVNGAEHGRQLVQEYKKAGYDLLKIHEGLTKEEYEAIISTARELGMRYAGHVPDDVGVRRAIAVGQGIDHLDGYYEETGDDDAKIVELAKLTRDAGIWLAPTMDLWKTIRTTQPAASYLTRPELKYVTRQARDGWVQQKENINGQTNAAEGAREVAARNQILKALYDAGAHVMLGSDAPQLFSVPGFSLEHEMPAMIAAGLPVEAVLTAGTRTAAQYFGEPAEFGTVESGKRADLLLVDANPLTDIRNVHRQAGVMVRGRWLPKEEIDRRLAEIAERLGKM